MREQGVPEKYVRLVKDTYEDARTQVKISIGLPGKITVTVGLHQGSSLRPYMFDMILDVMGRGIKEQPPWCMLFADDIVMCSTRRDHVERKLEEWRRAMEERGWLDKVKDDIKEKGLSADDVYDRATWRRMSSYIDPT